MAVGGMKFDTHKAPSPLALSYAKRYLRWRLVSQNLHYLENKLSQKKNLILDDLSEWVGKRE